jgi:hypothetical protein
MATTVHGLANGDTTKIGGWGSPIEMQSMAWRGLPEARKSLLRRAAD